MNCVSRAGNKDKIKKMMDSEEETLQASGAHGDKEEEALPLLTGIFMTWQGSPRSNSVITASG